ncbi:MAG: hypothetical protein GYB64_13520 [Chloroflexi bacterium]|nr:hypothetical protein [Chloroflexota bacterium]
MPEPLLTAFVQAPFVLIVAYLTQRFLVHLNARDAEWRAFIQEANDRLAHRMGELTQAVERLSERSLYRDLMDHLREEQD